jgi:hypothetical protein
MNSSVLEVQVSMAEIFFKPLRLDEERATLMPWSHMELLHQLMGDDHHAVP